MSSFQNRRTIGDVLSGTALRLETLEQDSSVIYVVDADFRFVYCNPAWDRFAVENQGYGLARESMPSRQLFDYIGKSLEHFYRRVFAEARTAKRVCRHEFECSSPDVYRVHQMQIMPLLPSSDFVIICSPLRVRPHNREEHRREDEVYREPTGMLRLCSHCRRTRRSDGSGWDWVPFYVRQKMIPTTHALCSICFSYYYPAIADRFPTLPD